MDLPLDHDIWIKSNLEEYLASNTQPKLVDAVQSLKGAFPAIIGTSGIGFSRWNVSKEDLVPLDTSDPELHPLQYEWPFDPETVSFVSSLLAEREVLLLGMPSIAAKLDSEQVSLVDSSNFIAPRFALQKNRSVVITQDVLTFAHSRLVDAVAFDAPWYLGEMLLWLEKASNLVRPGGKILAALWGPGLRPTAIAERESFLKCCERIGDLEVYESALTYTTPLFERQALLASGLPPLARWRRADLVQITSNGKRRPIWDARDGSQPEPLTRSEWITRRVGRQVIKLRVSANDSDLPPKLEEIAGLRNYVSPSVSMRDPNRNLIDIWSSRNRVARCFSYVSAKRILTSFEDARPTTNAVTATRLKFGSEVATSWARFLDL